MKLCRTCKIEKNLDEFHKKLLAKDGRVSDCKGCVSNRLKAYYNKNRTIIIEKVSNRYRDKKEEVRTYKQNHYKKNKEKIRKKITIYVRNKRRNDIEYRLKSSLRRRLSDILRGRIKSGSAVRDLGCSAKELKLYLENYFPLYPKMNWSNYGSEWELDHYTPLSAFNLTDKNAFLEAFHYTNLQPLWREENRKKGAELPWR